MSTRPKIKTTIKEAINYWINYVDEFDLSVDWSEADTHCWRCGCERNLQRCHIIPHSLGGEDSPSNIVLLCKRCHAEGPNVVDPEIMWDWIRAYKVPFYGTFWNIWGLKEYKFIYNKSFYDEIKELFEQIGIPDLDMQIKIVNKNLKQLMKKASRHFGQPYLNTATIAGLHRMVLKDIAKKYKVTLSKPEIKRNVFDY